MLSNTQLGLDPSGIERKVREYRDKMLAKHRSTLNFGKAAANPQAGQSFQHDYIFDHGDGSVSVFKPTYIRDGRLFLVSDAGWYSADLNSYMIIICQQHGLGDPVFNRPKTVDTFASVPPVAVLDWRGHGDLIFLHEDDRDPKGFINEIVCRADSGHHKR